MDPGPNNFRPLFENISLSESPNIYRSSTFDNESNQSIKWLRETIAIKSYVDVRHVKELTPTSKLNNFFIFRRFKDITYYQLEQDSNSEGKSYRYNVNLFARNFDSRQDKRSLFYIKLLDDSQQAFHKIFLIMTYVKCFPILVTSKRGNNRTGVLVAVIMELVGCTDEDIINDFSKTNEYYKQLGWQESTEFPETCREKMEILLNHLKNTYGGAEGYLKSCGLSKEQIGKIKINLSRPFAKPPVFGIENSDETK